MTLNVTGLEGRIFTGIFLEDIDDDHPQREEFSTRLYDIYLAALKRAFPDAELDYEEIDGIPLYDSFTAKISDDKWKDSWDLDKEVVGFIGGVTYGIEAAIMEMLPLILHEESIR